MSSVGLAVLVAGIWIGSMIGSKNVAAEPGTKFMNVVRLYTGADGQSHFEEVLVQLADKGKIGFLSEKVNATGLVFRETGGNYDYDFHVAPRR